MIRMLKPIFTWRTPFSIPLFLAPNHDAIGGGLNAPSSPDARLFSKVGKPSTEESGGSSR